MSFPYRFWNGLASAALLLSAGISHVGSAADAAPPKAADDKAKGANKSGAITRRPFNVRTAYVTTQPLTYEVRAVGNITATDIYRIDARVPGTLYDIKFSEGDEINVDTVLCTIAPEAYRFKAQKQEALYKQAVADLADFKRKTANQIERTRIDLDRAKLEVARRIAVKEAGAISNEEIQLYQSRSDLATLELKDSREAAETAVKTLEAKIMETEADWKIAEDDVRKSVVKSPIKGVIEKRFVTNGMFVQAGQQLASIIDRTQIKVRFKVSESESAIAKVGSKIQFEVPAFPGRKFEAEIYYVGGKLEDDARVVMVYANVTKDTAVLKPGYFAAVSFTEKTKDRAIVVPLSAIQPTERGMVSFVVVDGKAERRQVKTGIAVTERDVEIVEGLKEGELLVIDGANALSPNTPVRVVEGPGAEPPKAKEISIQGN